MLTNLIVLQLERPQLQYCICHCSEQMELSCTLHGLCESGLTRTLLMFLLLHALLLLTFEITENN